MQINVSYKIITEYFLHFKIGNNSSLCLKLIPFHFNTRSELGVTINSVFLNTCLGLSIINRQNILPFLKLKYVDVKPILLNKCEMMQIPLHIGGIICSKNILYILECITNFFLTYNPSNILPIQESQI